MQIGSLSRMTQYLIDNQDKDNLKKAYDLALDLITNGNDKVINALNVSYLEHLNFKNGKVNREWALTFMNPRLRKHHKEMMDYLYNLFKNKS